MTKHPRVGLVTCVRLPEPDPDESLLIDALRRKGIQAEMLAWDDPKGDPGRYDLCVLRSCWNYHEQPEKFLSWISGAASVSRLANPLENIVWNIHKSYLRKVEKAGVPIIPTRWVHRGERADLRAIMRAEGWGEVVVKPAVSAASYRTRRFGIHDASAGQLFLDSLLGDRDTMVQRYLPEVENGGERAVVWIDGEVTHAVAKSPRFEQGEEKVSEALRVSAEQRELVRRALSCAEAPLLYARADFLSDGDRGSCLSELELMEPSLFLLQHPPALTRFVAAIRRWCEQGVSSM